MVLEEALLVVPMARRMQSLLLVAAWIRGEFSILIYICAREQSCVCIKYRCHGHGFVLLNLCSLIHAYMHAYINLCH